MEEIIYNNARVRIHGEPDMEHIKAATTKFAARVIHHKLKKAKKEKEGKTA